MSLQQRLCELAESDVIDGEEYLELIDRSTAIMSSFTTAAMGGAAYLWGRLGASLEENAQSAKAMEAMDEHLQRATAEKEEAIHGSARTTEKLKYLQQQHDDQSLTLSLVT